MQISEEERFQLFKTMLGGICNLSFWHYDANMNLMSSTYEDSAFLDRLFALNDMKPFLQEYNKTRPLPVALYDATGLMWAAVPGTKFFDNETLMAGDLYLMGPAFINDNGVTQLEKAILPLDTGTTMKRKLLAQIKNFPVISSSNFYQYIIMFHGCICNEQISIADLTHASWEDTKIVLRENYATEASFYDNNITESSAEESNAERSHTGAHSFEKELLAIIENGNIAAKDFINQGTRVSSGVRAKIGDSVRNAKYSAVSLAALCTRAAIKGGLPAATAYTLNDRYTQMIDGCKTLIDVRDVNAMMYEDFINRVHKCKEHANASLPVRTCCDYIQMHLKDPIFIEDLASLVGYTDYYLSRKFKKELGISINAYIQRKRIEYAKLLLTSTNYSVTEISSELQFCSRSYFANAFTKEVGMSPSAYRSSENS